MRKATRAPRDKHFQRMHNTQKSTYTISTRRRHLTQDKRPKRQRNHSSLQKQHNIRPKLHKRSKH